MRAILRHDIPAVNFRREINVEFFDASKKVAVHNFHQSGRQQAIVYHITIDLYSLGILINPHLLDLLHPQMPLQDMV